MTLDELRSQVEAGTIDTVLVCLVDMQGRLQGKRMDASFFLEETAEHGAEACNYLLAVDVEMTPVDGYAMSSWERGYGDLVLIPDLDNIVVLPWHERTALCIADARWPDGSEVVASPRQILKRQLARAAERGWSVNTGTELEFIAFEQSYEAAWDGRYSELTPVNRYNVDYSVLGTSRVESLVGPIRRAMSAAGMKVLDSKGEANHGQHEINFHYAEALRACDQHVIFKNGAKEIASQLGRSLTFMAKVNAREGNSCHIHLSLADAEGSNVFAGESPIFEAFLAGAIAGLRELTLLLAPNVNSYKRFAARSFAPTAVAWGHDNRTCAFRVVGSGAARRFECRVAGGDVNPYLAVSALIAAGLDGIDRDLTLEPPEAGSAYESGKPRVPDTMQQARDLFAASELAAQAFGTEMVTHYTHMADIELHAYNSTVTDWELIRGFERL